MGQQKNKQDKRERVKGRGAAGYCIRSRTTTQQGEGEIGGRERERGEKKEESKAREQGQEEKAETGSSSKNWKKRGQTSGK